ncbi:hypothetical protein EG327_001817 [Venturia inaequalis]|uniref:Trehalase n=1 Tax=Venturia inaequalis TaxID=5025 RepID=A0A8H3Z931_VENIN|nr:hypothetical protein EG327_001817 [Venturia inaequalis]
MNSQSSQIKSPKRQGTLEIDPLSAARVYYGDSHNRKAERVRTYSAIIESASRSQELAGLKAPLRHERTLNPRKFMIPVEETLRRLLEREDTDKNMQITVDDLGPKVLSIGTAASNGYNRFELRGTYTLSNLLQELSLAKAFGRRTVILDEIRLNENPVNRMARLIKDEFWHNLTRKIDGGNIAQVARDPKDWTSDPRPRVYVPYGLQEQLDYYNKVAADHPDIRLEVIELQEDCDNEDYVSSLNAKPGLLAVEMLPGINEKTGEEELQGCPFVVPGGRFNELYGWDSYMESLGLIVNGKLDLVESMIRNHCFLIRYYNKILNANRSYYLCRSQPPFLTDMALRWYEKCKHKDYALDLYKRATLAAIKEYYSVWMSAPRHDATTGLSRYYAGGKGVPPETEPSHFQVKLTPYAEAEGMTYEAFIDAYNNGHVKNEELDMYFRHDRGVRESGHDTSYRLEGCAAHLATVDLNSLLYKYECDISKAIRTCFGDKLFIPKEWRIKSQKDDHFETSAVWDRRARRRRMAVDKYLWNEEKGMYFDYNTETKEQTDYECATTFWPLFAGLATPRQAAVLVQEALPKLEAGGGLLSGSEKSRGEVGLHRPNRQWDYPFGWAPQQMLAWIGLQRYGFDEEAQRLIYKWLFMVTKAFVDFNGVVVEKYNIMRPHDPHKVEAEYGNQGADFKGVAKEGFGWVNASYVFGLDKIPVHMKRALGALSNWDTYCHATNALGLRDDDILVEAEDY